VGGTSKSDRRKECALVKRGSPNFWEHAQRYPGDLALIDERERHWSAAQLLAAVNRMSNGLAAMGVGQGSVVATLMPKRAELIVISLATSQLGLYLLTLNPQQAITEICSVLADSQARLLIVDPQAVPSEWMPRLILALQGQVITVGEFDGLESYDSFIIRFAGSMPASRSAGAILTYTSGTTGTPKAVLRPLRGDAPERVLEAQIRWYMKTFSAVPRSGVHLCVCPLHYSGPLMFASYALHLGQTVALLPVWHPRMALRWIEQYRVTTTFMVPSQFVSLLKLSEEQRRRFCVRSLQCVIHGSAPCPESVKRAMLDWLGTIVYECYGSTEVAGVVSTPGDWLAFPGTVGRAIAPHEVRIYDERGDPVPAGTVGSVFLRALRENEFTYHGDPERTRACRQGDFVTVGDLGFLNPQGYLFLLGRKGDLINCKGEKVFPAEVESLLITHPAVSDCAAFGARHAELGEEVRAAVSLANGVVPSTDLTFDLLTFLRARMTAGKCPRAIEYVERIPRDAAGKLRRRELQAGREAPAAGGRA
jgi:long-chain acyl-CoA synthetase